VDLPRQMMLCAAMGGPPTRHCQIRLLADRNEICYTLASGATGQAHGLHVLGQGSGAVRHDNDFLRSVRTFAYRDRRTPIAANKPLQ
jgi:hypothetical protein